MGEGGASVLDVDIVTVSGRYHYAGGRHSV